jgi:hypothetical protein
MATDIAIVEEYLDIKECVYPYGICVYWMLLLLL